MNTIYIYLPWGPSINNYWLAGSGKNRFVSKKGRKYRLDIVECISQQCPGVLLTERLCVDVVLYPPDKKRRDLDNHMKALLDAITHAGLWEDDEQIDQLQIYRGEIIKGGGARVEINPAGPILPFNSFDRIQT